MTTRDDIIRDAENLGDGLTAISKHAESSKFERCRDRELAAALSIIQLNGVADEEHGATDVAGYYARIGQYVFLEVGAGFCYFEDLGDENSARVKFEKIVKDYPSY